MNSPPARPGLKNIKPHMVSSIRSQTPAVIQIASNESVYGTSYRVKRVARSAIQSMERYSEGAEKKLSELIADHFGLQSTGVVCGHGSDDLLSRLARAYLRKGDEFVCSVNGYQKFPNYAYANDAHPIRSDDSHFVADVDQILASISGRTRMIMLANPDNPTGSWLNGDEVRRLIAGLPQSVLLVLDSAYYEYVDDQNFENPVNLVDEFDNVVITRTFSKLFGLAGLRIGWFYGPQEVAENIRKIGLTFPISNVAFACAAAALKDQSHQQYVRDSNFQVRNWFIETLRNMDIVVYPSQTNFVLLDFSMASISAIEVHNALIQQGILTRRLASTAFEHCIRITIGRMSEMRIVARAIQKLLS